MADPVLTWTAVQEEHVLETGYIDKVHWDCSGTDGTYSARAYGDVPLEQPSDLVPYAEFNMLSSLLSQNRKLLLGVVVEFLLNSRLLY